MNVSRILLAAASHPDSSRNAANSDCSGAFTVNSRNRSDSRSAACRESNSGGKFSAGLIPEAPSVPSFAMPRLRSSPRFPSYPYSILQWVQNEQPAAGSLGSSAITPWAGAVLRGAALRPGGRLFRSLLGRLLAGNRHQHFLLTAGRLSAFLAELRGRFGLARSSSDAAPQCFHQIDDVLALRLLARLRP
jgi:hypothetical protein